jgi:Contractile injection system tube protein
MEKAYLHPLNSPKAKEIKFMFNPNKLTFTRIASWTDIKGSRGDNDILPTTDFKGVKPYTLKISGIIFDTYETRTTVDKYINVLKEAVIPDDHTDKIYVEKPQGGKGQSTGSGKQGGVKNRRRPPVYLFLWGEGFNVGHKSQFKCVVTNLTYIYTMFLPNGIPVRAEVTLSLKEVDQIKASPDTKKTPQPTPAQRKGGGRPHP